MNPLTRRDLLRLCGTLSVGVALGACGVAPTPVVNPASTRIALPTAIPTLTGIPVPTITSSATSAATFAVAGLSPDQYPLAKLANEAIAQYAKANNLKSESVGMKAVQLTDYQAKLFKVLVTEDATPLLVQSEPGVWQEATLRLMYSRVGIKIGGHVDGGRELAMPQYGRTASENFDIYFPNGNFFQSTKEKYQDYQAKSAIDAAIEANSILINNGGFCKYDQDYLASIPEDQRLAKMKERVKTVLSYAMKNSSVQQYPPSYVYIFNEPFMRYKDGAGHDRVSWKNSLANQVLGDDVIIDTYIMFYEEAKAQGLEVGKDVFFFISEYGISTNNPKKDLALREMRRAIDEIAKRLGMSVKSVKLGMAIQQRYDESNPDDMPNDNRGRVRPPTEQELETTTQEFQGIVDMILFTECSDLPATAEQRQTRFATIVKVAKKLGIVGVEIENPLRFYNLIPDTTWESSSLFNPQYEKLAGYYALLRNAYSLLPQNR